MKKLERYIVRNWIWFVVGIVLTRKAVECAYAERGYAAIGGEWFVLPMLLLVIELIRDVADRLPEFLELWNGDDARE